MSGQGRVFAGRAVIPGNVRGEALVTHQGFNSLASFYRSMVSGESEAVCSDQDNRAIHGQVMTGKIICLPKTTGSTSAGATWDRVASTGIGPAAMLFSEPIDSLAAAGLLIAEIWVGKPIVAIDRLGNEFLHYVENGCILEVREDGIVTVHKDSKPHP